MTVLYLLHHVLMMQIVFNLVYEVEVGCLFIIYKSMYVLVSCLYLSLFSFLSVIELILILFVIPNQSITDCTLNFL